MKFSYPGPRINGVLMGVPLVQKQPKIILNARKSAKIAVQ
ncbi:hypothetical protein XBJ2_1300092 [Xenorhabdus bovienii str. Jollieti]|nr:hypothetical protein XBJ2_1300092 [Xenorhabdus bovienii str. Jollieti]